LMLYGIAELAPLRGICMVHHQTWRSPRPVPDWSSSWSEPARPQQHGLRFL
jgi:hypothetical protein